MKKMGDVCHDLHLHYAGLELRTTTTEALVNQKGYFDESIFVLGSWVPSSYRRLRNYIFRVHFLFVSRKFSPTTCRFGVLNIIPRSDDKRGRLALYTSTGNIDYRISKHRHQDLIKIAGRQLGGPYCLIEIVGLHLFVKAALCLNKHVSLGTFKSATFSCLFFFLMIFAFTLEV